MSDAPRLFGAQFWDDSDPLRRVCLSYTGGVVFTDGAQVGPRTCRAGVAYSDAGVDLGEMILALPCTGESIPCARREWGPRRGEGRGLFGEMGGEVES